MKRLHYDAVTLGKGHVTQRLVEETGMSPDALAEVIGGYFAEVLAGARQPEIERERQMRLFDDDL